MPRLLPPSFGDPPPPLPDEYVGCYSYDRRISKDDVHLSPLVHLLRSRGFRPPSECPPGLYESYLPNISDVWMCLTDSGHLQGLHGAAWLPRDEPPDLSGGAAKSWGRGRRYRPLSPCGLVTAEFDHYHSSREYLVGVEFGRPAKLFGPKIGRAMRWWYRGSNRTLHVVPRWDYPPWRAEDRPTFPRTAPPGR